MSFQPMQRHRSVRQTEGSLSQSLGLWILGASCVHRSNGSWAARCSATFCGSLRPMTRMRRVTGAFESMRTNLLLLTVSHQAAGSLVLLNSCRGSSCTQQCWPLVSSCGFKSVCSTVSAPVFLAQHAVQKQ